MIGRTWNRSNTNLMATPEARLLRLHDEPCVHYSEAVVHAAVMEGLRPFMDALERFYVAWASDPTAVWQPCKQVQSRSGTRGDWRVMPCSTSASEDFGGCIDAVKVIGTNEEEQVVGDKISVGKALLLHPTDHHVEAIFDVAALSSFRTAAVAVLAAKYGGYSADMTAGIIGAGRVGFYTAAILVEWLGCSGLLVTDTNRPRADLFVLTVAERVGRAVRAAGLEETCRASGAIFLGTSSPQPVVDAALACNVRFISSVGADADNLAELFPDLLAGRLLVSESAQNVEFGDLRRWRAAGLIDSGDIHLLADVIADGVRGRPVAAPVLFVSTGAAIQDALLCRFLHGRLRGRGGRRLDGGPAGGE